MAAHRKYQWEEWFDRPRTVLIRGIHYDCSQSSMVGMIRNAASKHGAHIRVLDVGDSIVIEVVSAVPHPNEVAVAG